MKHAIWPVIVTPASTEQRFDLGDTVSHNAGVIDLQSKRTISGLVGYDKNGGFQYRVSTEEGIDKGLAYDCELDPWPADFSLPQTSHRC